MPPDFHAVKLAAETQALRHYGLEKSALIAPATLQRLRSGGAGGLVGGALGAVHGFATASPSSDSDKVTLSDRLRSAARGGLSSGAVGAGLGAFGATAGQYGLNREGLKRMFSAVPFGPSGRGLIGEIAQSGLFGSPVTAYTKYKEDLARLGGSHARAIGEQYRRAFLPNANDGLIGKGLHYAITAGNLAYPAYTALKTDDPDERNRMLASLAVGTAVSPLTGQLGLPGVYVQQQLQNLAERAVSSKPKALQPAYTPRTHAHVIRTGLNIHRSPDYAVSDYTSGATT